MQKLSIILLISYGLMNPFNHYDYAAEMYTPPEESREELYQDIFLSLLLPYIDKKIALVYRDLLTVKPAVYPYDIQVKEAKRLYEGRSFAFLITLAVRPVVGPHLDIGLDEFVFLVTSSEVTLKHYKHLKTYDDFPPNWQHIFKK